MALPWLKILDLVMGLTDVARQVNRRPRAALRGEHGDREALAAAEGPPAAALETKLAGVMVAALKEVFERDNQRVQIERERLEADRTRAERLLRLDLARQAADRELARLRVITFAAAAAWLVTWIAVAWLGNQGLSGLALVLLGLGWVLLLGSLGSSMAAQSAVASRLTSSDVGSGLQAPDRDLAAVAAFWLLLTGLIVSSMAVLV